MSRYDGAVTLFSPDGHLLQVEYAHEAVRKGSTVVGLCNKDCVVIGVEKKALDPLQIERTVRKIKILDEHLIMTYAGLTADARVLMNRAKSEAQSHRANFERAATVEYIARYVAKVKQQYTQSNGLRPFGVACLIGGFDDDGRSHLFQTDPSGIVYEWSANSTGRMSQTVREYLQKNAAEVKNASDEAALIKLMIAALHESTNLGAAFFEVAVLKYKQPLRMVSPGTVGHLVAVIKQEMAEKEAQQKKQVIK